MAARTAKKNLEDPGDLITRSDQPRRLNSVGARLIAPLQASTPTMQFHLKTFGCQMNFSDSERIASLLGQNNWQATDQINQAHLVIFNTCGVRQTAEDRLVGQIHNLQKANPEAVIVVTGCLARREDVQRKLLKNKQTRRGKRSSAQKEKLPAKQGEKYSAPTATDTDKIIFLPIKDLTTLPSILQENFGQLGSPKSESGTQEFQEDYLSLVPQYQKSSSILVPIMTGCNNFCSYCVVPYARGRETSRAPKKIIKEIKLAQATPQEKKESLKEVLLLGQNVNSYSYQSESGPKTSFPELLKSLAQKFPAITFRFLTSHPKDFSNELIEVIKQHSNLSRKIHLPVQSGSARILQAMNRHYTPQHYLELVAKIKNALPGARLSTDVIVGFPDETEEDFQATANIFRQVGFGEAYINKYSPRPGTAAEKLGDPIPWKEKKRREKELRRILEGNS